MNEREKLIALLEMLEAMGRFIAICVDEISDELAEDDEES